MGHNSFMKNLFTLLSVTTFLFSTSVSAFDNHLDSVDCQCNVPYQAFGHDGTVGLGAFARGTLNISKRAFKRREPSNLFKLVAIDSDFKVPPVVGDTWWGNIYLEPKDNTLRYRDEVMANSNYNRELSDPRTPLTHAKYKANDINSPGGLVLMNDHGAFISVKNDGRPFDIRTGGNVIFTFKSPGGNTARIKMNIVIRNGRPVNTVITPGGPVAFDTLKVRTGFTGIVGGVSKIEFKRAGVVAYTLDP